MALQLAGPFYKKYPVVPFRKLPASVNKGFQVLFHSPPGVLFTFPSQYYFTIGHQVVFRLGGWSPRLPTGFLVSRGTLDTAMWISISCTGLSPSLAGFPKTVLLSKFNQLCSPQPRNKQAYHGLASSAFARRYLGNHYCFLFLPLLRCFSSRRFPSHSYVLAMRWLRFAQPGFPIRIPTAQRLYASPRGFSQLSASFIGSWCQGIHPLPLFAWPTFPHYGHNGFGF